MSCGLTNVQRNNPSVRVDPVHHVEDPFRLVRWIGKNGPYCVSDLRAHGRGTSEHRSSVPPPTYEGLGYSGRVSGEQWHARCGDRMRSAKVVPYIAERAHGFP